LWEISSTSPNTSLILSIRFPEVKVFGNKDLAVVTSESILSADHSSALPHWLHWSLLHARSQAIFAVSLFPLASFSTICFNPLIAQS